MQSSHLHQSNLSLDSLEGDVSVFLRTVAHAADLAQGLLAAEGAPETLEAAVLRLAEVSFPDVSHVEVTPAPQVLTMTMHRMHPPPVQALGVVLHQPPGPGVEALTEHGHAVLALEVAQAPWSVGLQALTHQVVTSEIATGNVISAIDIYL